VIFHVLIFVLSDPIFAAVSSRDVITTGSGTRTSSCAKRSVPTFTTPSVAKVSNSSAQKVAADNGAAGKPALSAVKMARPGIKISSVGQAKKPGSVGDDVDSSPLYAANKLKINRFRDEAKLMLLKWNFATPRQEFVVQLKEQVRMKEV